MTAQSLLGLIDIVQQSQANLVGCGIVIEKGLADRIIKIKDGKILMDEKNS